MSRRFHFGTNLKMHMTDVEVRAFLTALGPDSGAVDRFVLPPFTALHGLVELAQARRVAVGAQNAHYAVAGPYTGEISVGMLTALGVGLVMVGHAERRSLFGDTDEIVARKVAAVLGSGSRLLLCVGENMDERRAGQAAAVLTRQLASAVAAVAPDALDRVMIAYEPVWSIGETGVPATTQDIAPALAHVREAIFSMHGDATAAVPLLYGGSVNLDNCADYAALDQVDGLFVGRAAWSPAGYEAVLARAHQASMARRS